MIDDVLTRIWENLGGRIGGPLTFRLILQPLVASLLAINAGLLDARTGRPPYFWTILTNAAARRALVREGWKAVARVFVVAMIMDAVYQLGASFAGCTRPNCWWSPSSWPASRICDQRPRKPDRHRLASA